MTHHRTAIPHQHQPLTSLKKREKKKKKRKEKPFRNGSFTFFFLFPQGRGKKKKKKRREMVGAMGAGRQAITILIFRPKKGKGRKDNFTLLLNLAEHRHSGIPFRSFFHGGKKREKKKREKGEGKGQSPAAVCDHLLHFPYSFFREKRKKKEKKRKRGGKEGG